MIVHQLLSGAGPVDAVTRQAIAWRHRFTEWGWGGKDIAAGVDPRVGRRFRLLDGFTPEDGDVLLLHYSAYAPRLRPLLDRPRNPSLLLSHNVTPAKYMWAYEPVVAVHCEVGRAQLPGFAQAATAVAGVSEYNTAELRDAGVTNAITIPLLVDTSELGSPRASGEEPPGPPTVLFVGRLAPHKRHDRLLRAFAIYRRRHAPDARLMLVGSPIGPGYRERLEELGTRIAPGAVTIESDIDTAALAQRYREAHVFCCLSEHEGFCVPLLESFHFGVPVVARRAGGVSEVAGDAALLVADDDPAVVAELLHLAVTDGELRSALRERAPARIEHYAPKVSAEAMRSALERLAAGDGRALRSS